MVDLTSKRPVAVIAFIQFIVLSGPLGCYLASQLWVLTICIFKAVNIVVSVFLLICGNYPAI